VIGDRWLVTGGLVAGDKVIVEGLNKIGPGMPVKPSEVTLPAAGAPPAEAAPGSAAGSATGSAAAGSAAAGSGSGSAGSAAK